LKLKKKSPLPNRKLQTEKRVYMIFLTTTHSISLNIGVANIGVDNTLKYSKPGGDGGGHCVKSGAESLVIQVVETR
jgi:hypothetical protein